MSWAQVKVLQFLRLPANESTQWLRDTNLFLGASLLRIIIHPTSSLLAEAFQANTDFDLGRRRNGDNGNSRWRVIHAAANMSLFPLLFFFYGLYYTDILSAFFVMFTYYYHLQKRQNMIIFAGLASLLFRQTNVFWVGVFLGGLEICRNIPRGRIDVEFPRRATFFDVLSGSWNHSCAYDPFIYDARIEGNIVNLYWQLTTAKMRVDYFKTIISIGIAVLRNLTAVLWSLSSYFLILLAFLEFVIWNGGVVLGMCCTKPSIEERAHKWSGDKENHIASIHLAQMLYIWPYFIFFSFPILYPIPLNALIFQDVLPGFLRRGPMKQHLPRLVVSIPIMAAMLAVVHFNTIVHPFTLADNRHYMFYVFRILLRFPSLKYLAVPIYFVSAWVCLSAMGQGVSRTPLKTTKTPTQPRVLAPPPAAVSTRASFLLIWLLTTTLSLSTAPLVEPRYFILPWLTWRMHIAAVSSSSSQAEQSRDEDNGRTENGTPDSTYDWFDHTLWLESIWFIIINAVTGYTFLYKGFSWPQEPGKVQRFMW